VLIGLAAIEQQEITAGVHFPVDRAAIHFNRKFIHRDSGNWSLRGTARQKNRLLRTRVRSSPLKLQIPTKPSHGAVRKSNDYC
jgi:hypothetical protein